MLEIRQLPALKDNYIYLARDPETEACAAIDPAAADPVLGALDRLGWRLTLILNTHHHGDHVGGNLDLKRVTKCTIIGHKRDARRIPGIDLAVEEGDHVAIGAQKGTVLDVSGHTVGHIAYWFPGSFALFCGDTLFSLGCGRLFEGTAAQMWESLKKLRALPDATRVFCGHEYTEGNARFALSVDPGNRALEDRAAEVRRLRTANSPTVPSTLASEKAANPFLRADDAGLQRAMGLTGRDPAEVFAALRRQKDVF